ncbi:MAG: PIN domain-containing protein [Cyanobacteriota bacterium]|nr:PIN domain-containing protein [Cyanobacteriota bacterium]
MILVVDANVLIGESLRQRGQQLIKHASLTIHATEKVLDEAGYELPLRIQQMILRNRITQETGNLILQRGIALINTNVSAYSNDSLLNLELEAKERIPRDPDDWQTVALAIVLGAAIWTLDSDFLGCGIPTWTTETLISHLNRYTSTEI